jgi:hypothetical protein
LRIPRPEADRGGGGKTIGLCAKVVFRPAGMAAMVSAFGPGLRWRVREGRSMTPFERGLTLPLALSRYALSQEAI